MTEEELDTPELPEESVSEELPQGEGAADVETSQAEADADSAGSDEASVMADASDAVGDEIAVAAPADEASSEEVQEGEAEGEAEAEDGEPFDTGAPELNDKPEYDPDALILDLDGYEGPLDVLLTMAKSQKVDLAKISMLALVEQYLTFIAEAKRMKLELAADYLVMASWLTYLKSKLLLPEPEEEEEGLSGEELAARLQFQLQRLEAMRDAADKLLDLKRLGVDVFSRGAPEPIRVLLKPNYTDTLQDLLKAYTRQRTKNIEITYQPTKPPILAIEEARHRIETMLGTIADWSSLDMFLPEFNPGAEFEPRKLRTYKASTFTATLELVRDGYLEVRQLKQFGPVYVRRRPVEEIGQPANSDEGGETGEVDSADNLVAFPVPAPKSDAEQA